MYVVEEIFKDDGYELKEILKGCFYKYYLINKEEPKSKDGLQNFQNSVNLNLSSENALLLGKEI